MTPSPHLRPSTAILALALLTLAAVPAAAEPLTWKLSELAMLRIDDAAPKDWNVYQVEKKIDRFLVQLGGRFLLVDAQQQQVFDLPPASIERKGADLLWDPADRPAKPLPASNWTVRDVGLAYRVRVRLETEGRVVDLQIPHSAGRR